MPLNLYKQLDINRQFSQFAIQFSLVVAYNSLVVAYNNAIQFSLVVGVIEVTTNMMRSERNKNSDVEQKLCETYYGLLRNTGLDKRKTGIVTINTEDNKPI